MVENLDTQSEVTKKLERRVGSIVKKAIRWGGAVVAAAGIMWGANMMFRNDNMNDVQDLAEFTSADHQDDRCNIQAAFDAQVKMHDFFEDKGGVTEADAQLMAPVVGLEPEEITQLLDTELFTMDYDCEVPVASTNEATKGMVAVSLGLGALTGAAVVGATKRNNQ
ncbi:hypothetical protein KDA00_03185 [Candidatus Saccharibacteria bacterium]|nr:hypothetical protein [Candidatus Saccharibacteria bacterium]